MVLPSNALFQGRPRSRISAARNSPCLAPRNSSSLEALGGGRCCLPLNQRSSIWSGSPFVPSSLMSPSMWSASTWLSTRSSSRQVPPSASATAWIFSLIRSTVPTRPPSIRNRLGFSGRPYSTHRESPRYAGSISTVNIGLLLAGPASGVAANVVLEHCPRVLGRPPDRLPVRELHGNLIELALGRGED